MVTEEGPDSTVTVAVASSVRRFTFGCGYTISSTEPGSGGEGGGWGGVFSHCGCRVFLDCKKQQSKLVRRGSCPKCFVWSLSRVVKVKEGGSHQGGKKRGKKNCLCPCPHSSRLGWYVSYFTTYSSISCLFFLCLYVKSLLAPKPTQTKHRSWPSVALPPLPCQQARHQQEWRSQHQRLKWYFKEQRKIITLLLFKCLNKIILKKNKTNKKKYIFLTGQKEKRLSFLSLPSFG